MDKILLNRIEVSCIIGLLEEEKLAPQTLFISIDAEISLKEIGESDDLKHGIDYCKIIEKTRFYCEHSNFLTIEALAHNLAIMLKKSFLRIRKIRITIEKPKYAKDLKLQSIEIHVER